MKKYFTAFALTMLFALAGCSKDGGSGSGGGNIITDEAEAELVLTQFDNLWNGVLKSQLTKQQQHLSDSVLTDGGSGNATVNGSYTITSSSSSSSSLYSTSADFYITFSNYTANGLTLDGGPLRFFEYHYSNMACSSAGCASSTKSEIAYQSSELNSNATPSITVSFTSDAGIKYKDKIIFSASKEYTSWSGKLINSKNDTISFIY